MSLTSYRAAPPRDKGGQRADPGNRSETMNGFLFSADD